MAEKNCQPNIKDAEFRYLIKFKIVESITSLLNMLMRIAGYVLIAFFTYKSIEIYSIHNTNVNLTVGEVNVVKNLFSFDFFKTPSTLMALIGVVFGITGILYGKNQRDLRMSTVEKLQGRIKEFETVKDPNRSSSMLTPRGETRPEDR